MILNSLLFLAQAAPAAGGDAAQQPSFLIQMLPLVFIFVIFYFMLIRPQQKRQKEHQKLISGVKSGDRVVTNAGIHGIVANVKDKTIVIKVADNVKLEFDRGAIATIKASADEPEETKA